VIEITRREILGLAAALVVVRPSRVPDAASATTGAGDVLIGLFPDRQRARVIGAAYLETDPRARDGSLALARFVHAHSPGLREDWIRLLRERIEEDYRVDRLAMIDRWLLAQTEAEACALTVLL
jgi:hypothetical protein